MRLLNVTIKGFRRFRDSSTVRLREKSIAVVGRNGAGKSSFLDALIALNQESAIPKEDYTRRAGVEPQISAEFLLEPDDREELEEAVGTSRVTHCIMTKSAVGSLTVSFKPEIVHDFVPRFRASESIDKVSELKLVLGTGHQREIQNRRTMLAEVSKILKSEATFLGENNIGKIEKAADILLRLADNAGDSANEPEKEEIQSVARGLLGLVEHERACKPYRAAQIVIARRPTFVLFDQEARNLKSQYDLTRVSKEPPPALANLATFTELELTRLLAAIQADDVAEATEMLDHSNGILTERIRESWIDPEVLPSLEYHGTTLRILVKRAGRVFYLNDRSDGYRWFLALVAFLHSVDATKRPILLIDEVETHLSYDAQAQLISVLEDQTLAQKVIYTTHSAGALPSDLGTGIRPVVQTAGDEEVSTIENAFWTRQPGFTPLFLAMGLAPLAFTPARNALIGEGASETLLLPSLIRETIDSESLPYQVAPGAAGVGETALGLLLTEAARTAFILDGDEGGEELRQALTEWGVPDDQVRTLRDFAAQPLTLEDLVAIDIFVEAYNKELEESVKTNKRIADSHVPDFDRMKTLEKWSEQEGLNSTVCKTVFAQRVAGMAAEGRKIADPRWVEALRELHDWAMRQFVST